MTDSNKNYSFAKKNPQNRSVLAPRSPDFSESVNDDLNHVEFGDRNYSFNDNRYGEKMALPI